MSTHVVGERPPLEVADVIRSHGEAFISKYGKHLSDSCANSATFTIEE